MAVNLKKEIKEMPEYECLDYHRVSCGWAVKSKYKGKCPNCGGKLQEVNSDNKKYRKVEGYLIRALNLTPLKIEIRPIYFT